MQDYFNQDYLNFCSSKLMALIYPDLNSDYNRTMKKPTPKNIEVPYKYEELFFSTTDEKGVIKYGNEVFITISGYPEDVIMGAPHNIIRHPDMPRSVFKLFWEFLKSGSHIAAYVKNMAADGSYYWVMAFAFPVKNGYVSIRFKPSSPIFQTVQELYQEILKKEKTMSLDEAQAQLLTQLGQLGFKTYQDFMVQASIQELKAREEKLVSTNGEVHSTDTSLNKITSITDVTTKVLDENFSKVDLFQKSSGLFVDTILYLQKEFGRLKFLSLNMSILATKTGSEAAALVVISEEFSKLSSQIEAQMASFSNLGLSLQEKIKQLSMHMAGLKTQMIMVDFFVKESIGNQSFSGMNENKDMFTDLFSISTTTVMSEMKKLDQELIDLGTQINEIQKFVTALEIIKQTGAIESARKDSVKESFHIYIVEMSTFITILRNSIQSFNTERSNLVNNSKIIYEATYGIRNNISEIFDLALKKA